MANANWQKVSGRPLTFATRNQGQGLMLAEGPRPRDGQAGGVLTLVATV